MATSHALAVLALAAHPVSAVVSSLQLTTPTIAPRATPAKMQFGGQQGGFGGQQQGGFGGGMQQGGGFGGQQQGGFGGQQGGFGGQQQGGFGGQQQGGFGQQQGQQQGGFGGGTAVAQQGFGGQQQGGFGGGVQSGQRMWRIVSNALRNGAPSYHTLKAGDEQVLGRYDMPRELQHNGVSRAQCAVQILPNGDGTLYSCGKPPTGWRARSGDRWEWLYNGDTRPIFSGCQFTLDFKSADSCVYSCSEEGGAGGAGGQQPGMYGGAQQGGFGGQQQGGFGAQQQGQQQGGFGGQQGQQQGGFGAPPGGGFGGGAPPLPPGWESFTDEQGMTYYGNRQTGQTQWDPPRF